MADPEEKGAGAVVGRVLVELTVLLGLPPALLCAFLVWIAETGRARLVGQGGGLVWIAALLAAMHWTLGRSRAWLAAGAGAFLLGLGLLGTAVLRTPAVPRSALPGPASFYPGGEGYDRLSPAVVIPEIDQFKLGSYLLPLIDSTETVPGAAEVRRSFLGVYRELEADPDFVALGSAMPLGYFGYDAGVPRPEHHYVYVPPAHAGKRLPTLLFLHGSVGNFKGYLWVWKQLADRIGMTIVAPSYGAGLWADPGGTERVERALAFARGLSQVDPDKVYLAGLSNGALGVTRAAVPLAARLQGLIYLSPLLEEERVARADFREAWRGRRVLVIHGKSDRHIDPAGVDRAVRAMRAGGVEVELELFRGQQDDHYLFFLRRDEVLARVEGWLGRES